MKKGKRDFKSELRIKMLIFWALLTSPSDTPLSRYRISEKIGVPEGRLDTHLKTLQKAGLIVGVEKESGLFYILPSKSLCYNGLVFHHKGKTTICSACPKFKKCNIKKDKIINLENKSHCEYLKFLKKNVKEFSI